MILADSCKAPQKNGTKDKAGMQIIKKKLAENKTIKVSSVYNP